MALKEQVEEAFKDKFSSDNGLEVDVRMDDGDNESMEIRISAHSDSCDDIGYVNLFYSFDESKMGIYDIQVDGEFQGDGYGRTLVQGIEKAAEELGVESVHALESVNDSFWIYMGFSEFGSEFKKYV